jgi:cytidine deaminase
MSPLTLLHQLLDRAYVPYSHYPVAAVIRAKSGKLYGGVNVENAAYPLTRCAEQVAVGNMVAAGEQEIAEVWIMTTGDVAGTPCGGCRQVLSEFAGPETPVHCLLKGEEGATYTLASLLPFAFTPERLKPPR